MKQCNASLLKQGVIRTQCKFAVIQILIILLFVYMIVQSTPVDIQDTKQIDIVVEDVNHVRAFSEYRLHVYSDSAQYTFTGRGTLTDYSVREIYDAISVGDQLSIIYGEPCCMIGIDRIIIDARTESVIYRSAEEYYRSHKGAQIGTVFIFAIVELCYLGVWFIQICLHKDELRRAFGKIKNNRKSTK